MPCSEAVRGEAGDSELEGGILCHQLAEPIWLSLVGAILEAGAKLGKLSVINQVLVIWGLLSWIITRHHSMTACKSGLCQAGFLDWLF